MKKIITIFLLIMMAFALIACNDSPPVNSSLESTGSETDSSTGSSKNDEANDQGNNGGDADNGTNNNDDGNNDGTNDNGSNNGDTNNNNGNNGGTNNEGGNNGGTNNEGGNNGGTNNDGGNNGGEKPSTPSDNGKEKVIVEFNTGMGYFEDEALYEIKVDKGGRLSSFPTPAHDNPDMLFGGWYKDDKFTVQASRSDKYESDTMLYACWIERMMCTDGTYDHLYSSWDTDTLPSCTKPGTVARYCNFCNAKETRPGDSAKGHLFGSWTEVFMARERVCTRIGCGEKEMQSFDDVTLAALGSSPSNQIDGSTAMFYGVPFTNLINGNWNDSGSNGGVLSPKGQGTAYVIFTLIEPMTLDRIYFKGDGSISMNIYVQYEGEDTFTFIGLCGGVADKENTPFKTPDTTKNIVKVKLQEDNPPNGTSLWQEIAFVRISGEE